MKRIIMVFMLICCLIFSISAMAESSPRVIGSLDVEDFSVRLSVSGLTPSGRISIFARLADSELSEALESGEAAYAGQFYADSKGGFEAKLSLFEKAVSGEYIFSVADNKSGNVYESENIIYRTPADMQNAMKAINDAGKDSMTKEIEGNSATLILDISEFDDLSLDKKDEISGLFYKLRPAGGFKTPAELHKAFGASVVTVLISETEAPEELIRKYAGSLDADVSELDKMTKSEVEEAMKVLQSREYSDADSLKKALPESFFAGKVNAAATAGEIRTLFLETYEASLNLDLSDYNTLSNPSKVFSEIKSSKITGFEDAKEKFNDAVANQKKAEKSDSKGSSGSSGGGGGGYPVVPFENNQNVVNPSYESSVFSDLDSASWAKEYIEYLHKKGIVSGDGSGKFRPNDSVTRAEFVKMITAAFGIQMSGYKNNFADVSADSWYASYVGAGVDAGIINGTGDGLFSPDSQITREDLALICYRASNTSNLIPDKTNAGSFNDSSLVSDYAKDAVDALFGAKIINGDPSGSFRPKDGATRAEVCKIISELIKLKEVQA